MWKVNGWRVFVTEPTDPSGLLRRLLDKQELMERKHAYLRAADSCQPDRMVADFTDDIEVSYTPDEPPMTGRDAVRAWYRARLSTVVASSHHVSNFEFRFTGPDTATVHCYLYSWQRFAGHPVTADRHRFARYTDGWVRQDGHWRQSSLVCRVAGEYCNDAVPRIGEHIDWDRAMGIE
jgi:hypothetical protein